MNALPNGRADDRPLNKKDSQAVVVDSGLGFIGLHSEIASFIGEQAFDDLDAPVERVMEADAPTTSIP